MNESVHKCKIYKHMFKNIQTYMNKKCIKLNQTRCANLTYTIHIYTYILFIIYFI